jgi:hypothetical protein
MQQQRTFMNDSTAALSAGCYGIGQSDALARNRSGYRNPAEREVFVEVPRAA